MSWLCTAIARLNDFDDYEDATLMQAKIAACFAAFVTDNDATGTAISEEDPIDDKLETLEPGLISYLGPGKTVSFATPPNVPNQEIFSINNLRRIAVSLGVTYEEMTGDYSKVNYSSARLGRLAHYANVEKWREQMLIPLLCNGVWGWVMGMAAGLSGWQTIPTADWTGPPMAMLDPAQEGAAYTRLIRSGVMTLHDAIRERGSDPDQHLEEIAATNKALDAKGIILDSDPRHTSQAGQAQSETDTTDTGDAAAVPPNGKPNGKPSGNQPAA